MPNALLTHYNAENNLVIIIGLTDGIIRQKRDINIPPRVNEIGTSPYSYVILNMKLFIFLELEELVDFLRKKNNKTKLFFLLLISLQLIKKEKVLCIENCNVKKNAMTDILD